MKSLTSWLITSFMVMFWVFRIVVMISVQNGAESFGGFLVFNSTFEIIMLFVSLLCFVLIVKRNVLGGIIYLLGYGAYFGTYLVANAIPALISGELMDMTVLQNVFVTAISLVLGLVAILDIAFEKVKAKHFSDDKTDWYFGTDKYDRKYDERADKNQYRTL